MHSALHFIQNIDVNVYHWLSRFHGNWFLDSLAKHQEANTFFKSTILIAAYWYFWFREDSDKQQRRATILSIFVGTFAGLVCARMIASLAPFRIRPCYDPGLHHQALAVPLPGDFMNWSSFPSDHAAYLCALGFGLILLSRRLLIPVVLFLAEWVCMPRMYLGIHYMSDIVIGAAIGIFAVWATLHMKSVNVRVSRPLLAFADARPQVFFMVAYLTMYEMGNVFWDIREPVHAVMRASASVMHHKVFDVAAISLVLACVAVVYGYHSIEHDEDRSSHGPSHLGGVLNITTK
ncbi:MAG TPA: phosphatase PAP2 family protein [Terriglobales bacterium]|nr:phosphatase PAP2 family protein [Terriglobales bacterium]